LAADAAALAEVAEMVKATVPVAACLYAYKKYLDNTPNWAAMSSSSGAGSGSNSGSKDDSANKPSPGDVASGTQPDNKAAENSPTGPTSSQTPAPQKSTESGSKAKDKEGKPFSEEKRALVDMAKKDKKTGITQEDLEAYDELNSELPDPFPDDQIRGPEIHPDRPYGQNPHGHVGPVNHIPIIEN
jgi:hypothetical protein